MPLTARQRREIGQRIRQARDRKSLSGYALAKAVGEVQSNIAEIEKGRREFSLALLMRVASAVDVDFYWLLGRPRFPQYKDPE